MRLIKALYTLASSEGVYLSKGNEYELHQDQFKNYFVYDNFGNKFMLTQAELEYRFA